MNIVSKERVVTPFAVVPATLFAILLAAPARAQDPVVKPTTTTSIARLRAPAKITAAQQPDGRIRVEWSPVDGTARYTLYRSVPNSGQGYLTLSNPTDTAYVDSDVKAGLAYYYVVQTFDAGGGAGLKIGSQPVMSTITVGTTTTSTTATSPTSRVIEKPSWVNAQIDPYPHGQVLFQSKQSGVNFQVERGVVGGGDTTFAMLGTSRPGQGSMTDSSVSTRYPVETRLVYRVVAVDAVTPTLKSAPALTNEVLTYKLAPTVMAWLRISVQPSTETIARVNLFIATPERDWTHRSIGSMDPNIVSVTPDGGVIGHTPGDTYVVITGKLADGTIATILWRLYVVP